jgi:hypothetical protein
LYYPTSAPDAAKENLSLLKNRLRTQDNGFTRAPLFAVRFRGEIEALFFTADAAKRYIDAQPYNLPGAAVEIIASRSWEMEFVREFLSELEVVDQQPNQQPNGIGTAVRPDEKFRLTVLARLEGQEEHLLPVVETDLWRHPTIRRARELRVELTKVEVA